MTGNFQTAIGRPLTTHSLLQHRHFCAELRTKQGKRTVLSFRLHLRPSAPSRRYSVSEGASILLSHPVRLSSLRQNQALSVDRLAAPSHGSIGENGEMKDGGADEVQVQIPQLKTPPLPKPLAMSASKVNADDKSERKWNTKNLASRIGADAISAASAAVFVAPLISIIDR